MQAEPKLHNCMVKFLKSDRVQIIPTVQKTADDLWRTSDCTNCISHLHADAKTKAINYTVPEKVHQFFILYSNMSECLGKNATFEITGILQNKSDEGNVSALCKMCHNKYNKLNDHYNSLAKDVKGEVCMDIVDMMNYTRIAWSDNLNCSHRSADAAVVIVITLFIAISPLCFYLPLRYTSKEKIKQVLKREYFFVLF
ncbi:osteopetrosis-associated transmembrane protein 1-like [Plakobranchus ocellatus]|uniref:Osteopetrosis-associated transmembrane protein 1-like n=1 Tax=Plakobranchus ocellatus TaxID=259542 RepID=A0AAV4ABU8_9GAST|nr:osteopetrosis-associated transmembrane protein 1-like [Plakobranchus ocellatus]